MLRAAALSLDCAPRGPDLDDAGACQVWLRQVWTLPGLAEAVRQATPGLAGRIDEIIAGQAASSKPVRRAARSALRYVARAAGRPTPFGLFAGVSPVEVAAQTHVRWGTDHRPVARADALWLSDVIDRLETDPALLDLLDVVFTDVAAARGGRLQICHGAGLVSIRETAAVRAARDAMAAGSREIVVTDQMITAFAGRDSAAQLPPHIEMAARIHAASPEALDRGEFTLMIGLARSAGTLTSRFSAGEASASLAAPCTRLVIAYT